MGQLTVLTLLQLQAGLWLVTGKCAVQELPTHPPSSRVTQLPAPPNVLFRNSKAGHPIRPSNSPFPIYNRPSLHTVYCIIIFGCLVFAFRASSKISTWCRCAWNVGCLSCTWTWCVLRACQCWKLLPPLPCPAHTSSHALSALGDATIQNICLEFSKIRVSIHYFLEITFTIIFLFTFFVMLTVHLHNFQDMASHWRA